MKQTLKTIYTIILVTQLAACGIVTPTASPTLIKTESPTLAPVTSTPVIDSGVILPENIVHLTLIKALSMGKLTGIPRYSPDGQWLFLPTTAGVFMLDTISYGKSRFLVSASSSTYNYPIDISPDGKTLAISRDLIAIEDSHLLSGINISSSLEQEKGVVPTVQQAKFSPDGQLLALAYSSGQAGIWRLSDEKLLYTLEGGSLEFSADGRLIVGTIENNKGSQIRLYDVQTGALLRDWIGERAVFLAVDLLAVESTGATRVYSLSTGKVLYAFNGTYAAFSPDSQLVALLFQGRVEVREVQSGKMLYTLADTFEGVDSLTLSFASDGQTLSSSAGWFSPCYSGGAHLSLWRVADGTLIRKTQGDSFDFAPDGKSLVITGKGIEVWNSSDGSIRAVVVGTTNSISDLVFLPDGTLIAFNDGGDDPFLVYPAGNDQTAHVLLADLETVQGFSVDQLTNSSRFSKYLWSNTETGYLKQLRLKVSEHVDSSVAFSPDRQFMATGSDYDGKARLWDIARQNVSIEQTACSEKRVSDLAFSPDGQKLAVACSDPVFKDYGEPVVQVWQVSSGKRLMELSGNGYTMVAYSPDGRFLAGAGNHIKVWDATNGEALFGVDRDLDHNLNVQSVAFSPNGKILAFGMRDGSVELWSVPGGKQLSVLHMSALDPRDNHYFYNPVRSLTFSPDGKLLAIGLDDGSIRLWGIQ